MLKMVRKTLNAHFRKF